MTNEEAIGLLKRQKIALCYDCMHPQTANWCEDHCLYPEAFDMAISALEVQQAAGDTISRKQTVDAIADYALKMQEKFGHKLTINQCREAVYGVLDAIPPARPKLGKEKA